MNCSEIWREIDGYPSKLQVSNLGRVRSNGVILKGDDSSPYLRIKISHDGVVYRESVHRLVAQAFIPNPNNLPCVNHIDGDKRNNHVNNLEWCDHSYNLAHAFKIGLRSANGEKSPSHKLTNEDVIEIRNIYEKGKHSGNNANKLAIKYGVSSKCILNVVNYITW